MFFEHPQVLSTTFPPVVPNDTAGVIINRIFVILPWGGGRGPVPGSSKHCTALIYG